MIAGYLVDLAGFGLQPWAALAIAVTGVTGLAVAGRLRPRRDLGELFIWLAVCGCIAAVLARIAWPPLLLPGRGPDLTHHLLLVDYIEQTGHLVHDRSLDGSMGEMAHYTPGAHLLAVSAGTWFGVATLRAFFPLLAACAALTAGFVYLIARRVTGSIPYGIAAVCLLFLPTQYFHGAFTHDSFLAQTVATFFAVGTWWALVVFDEAPSTLGAIIVGVLLGATFLAWPIWIGPVVLAAVAVISIRRRPGEGGPKVLALALGPLILIAAIHMAGRWGWLGMVRTSGAVLAPSLASVGWLSPLLALAGVALTARDRRARVTVVWLLLIALQAVTLFVLARSQGASTPYMAFKMVYLAIYPMAVLGAVALARIPGGVSAGWLVAAVLVVVAVRPALTAPRTLPVIDLDLHEAGQWTRANVGQTCVDYLVVDAETAYWLHLAVLGNPRASERMVEIDRYDPRAAVGPWITAEGRSHAVADLRLLPDEVRQRVEIVKTFGHAAVIRRPGGAACYNKGL